MYLACPIMRSLRLSLAVLSSVILQALWTSPPTLARPYREPLMSVFMAERPVGWRRRSRPRAWGERALAGAGTHLGGLSSGRAGRNRHWQ